MFDGHDRIETRYDIELNKDMMDRGQGKQLSYHVFDMITNI